MESLRPSLFVILTTVLALLFWPESLPASVQVGAPIASPGSLVAGRPRQITITSRMSLEPGDPAIIASGVNLLLVDAGGVVISNLGAMRDDGADGDVVAGDANFTKRVTLIEPNAGQLGLVVSVPLTSVARRVLSSVTVLPVTPNQAPNADAGPDQGAMLGALVTLNGGSSSDPDGDPMTFSWSLVSVPQGSRASLSSPTTMIPAFVADAPGVFVAQLVVNDGALNSAMVDLM